VGPKVKEQSLKEKEWVNGGGGGERKGKKNLYTGDGYMLRLRVGKKAKNENGAVTNRGLFFWVQREGIPLGGE